MDGSSLDCPDCGEPGRLRYEDLRDRHFDAAGSWSLVACEHCDQLWLHPRPAQEALDRIYESYYTHEEAGRGSLLERALRLALPARLEGYGDAQLGRGERALAALLSRLGPLRELAHRSSMGLHGSQRGDLLDVGCGDGRFLGWMRELGWRVHGVERDAKGAQVAASALGSECIHASLEQAGAAVPGGFDALTLSHVIEHLLDPGGTLQACGRLLKPGGTLVVATPNLDSLGHQQFGRSWLHLDPPRHVRLFTAQSLNRLVESAGFEPSALTTPASSAHFAWQASRMLEERGRLPGIAVEGASPTRVLGSIAFWLREYRLVRQGRRCGEELLLSARRPAA